MPFNTIEEIIEDFREGKMVVVTDDQSRENEGDLIFAADAVTPEKVNFMAKYGRGLICVPMSADKLEHLGLNDMVAKNQDTFKTAFTVSVDAKKGITTGISAYDRARTIEVLCHPDSNRSDIVMPGHIFPLRAKRGGVLIRSGHTEAAVDLARLSGRTEAAVICEIMNEDGSMARTPELLQFAEKHGLKIGTIESLIQYRRKNDKLIEKISEAVIPTQYGEFRLICYRSLIDNREHLALVKGKIEDAPTLVRVHSECFTGDVLGSLRCDCGPQLHAAMQMIQKEGRGVLVYMRQEGRGIGLANKLKAYHLQDKGLDTVEANEKLGFKPDLREYGTGAQILVDIGVKQLRLITNNPRKIVGLEGYGMKMVERVPLETDPQAFNERYLTTKKEKLGHFLHIEKGDPKMKLGRNDNNVTVPLVPKTYEGSDNASGKKFGIVVSKFNHVITEKLLKGAIDCLVQKGASLSQIQVFWCPGAFEIPSVCGQLVNSKSNFDALIALGVVIRGDTPHFDYVCKGVTEGIMQVALQSMVPIAFGVLTTDTVEQAQARSSEEDNKGFDAAIAAIQMANLFRKID